MAFAEPPTSGSREFLERACSLSLVLRPRTAAAEKLVEAMTQRIVAEENLPEAGSGRGNRRRAKGLAKLHSAVGAIVGSLLMAWSRPAEEPAPVWRSNQAEKFTGRPVGRQTFRTVIDFLKTNGLIYHKKGWHPPRGAIFRMGETAGKGKPSCYWPTRALLDLAQVHRLTPKTLPTAFRTVAPQQALTVARPLQLRPLKERARRGNADGSLAATSAADPLPSGVFVAWTDSAVPVQRAEVEAHNALAQGTAVEGCVPPRWYRIFHGSWQLHGRWYAVGSGYSPSPRQLRAYHDLNPSRRAALRIGGEAVVELDVSGSHLTLLLGLLGLPLRTGDLYEDPGVPRVVFKQWIVTTLGQGRPAKRWSPTKQWASSLRTEAKRRSAKAVGSVVMAHYPCLRDPSQVVPADLMAASGRPAQDLLTHYLTG